MSTTAILSYDMALAGSGYIVNDTGEIAQSGNISAHYQILSVGGGGAVVTFTLTDGGDGYFLDSEVATQRDGGAGSGFAIDILVVGPGGGGGGSGYMNRSFGGASK